MTEDHATKLAEALERAIWLREAICDGQDTDTLAMKNALAAWRAHGGWRDIGTAPAYHENKIIWVYGGSSKPTPIRIRSDPDWWAQMDPASRPTHWCECKPPSPPPPPEPSDG